MMRENQKKLDGLIQEVMGQMHNRKYGRKTCSHYRFSFRLLISVSHDTGEDEISEKLIKAFLDGRVSCCGKWAAKERIYRQRCIRLLLSLAQTGNVDWGRQKAENIAVGLENEIFRSKLELFPDIWNRRDSVLIRYAGTGVLLHTFYCSARKTDMGSYLISGRMM